MRSATPPPTLISIYYGNEKVKKAASLISTATASQVHRSFCQFLHRLCTTTTWNDQILSSLENLNGKAIIDVHPDDQTQPTFEILLCQSELGGGPLSSAPASFPNQIDEK